MANLPKKVHVIGICGVATSALAIAFHEKGIRVTGSDKGFFPPVSTELEKHGIDFYAGWHPEKMFADNNLEGAVVVIGTASGSQNPETLKAKELSLPMYSFAEAIGEFFAKEKSVVCVGTWGKTSSSALLSHILVRAEMDPTYMFGGVSLSHESSAKLTDSNISVFEGDEYKSSPTDSTAKFFYYKPTHLLLSAVSWDHADLYPTEEEYFNAFKKLLAGIGTKGFVVACKDSVGVIKTLDQFSGKIIYYGRQAYPDNDSNDKKSYTYSDVVPSKDGLSFTISNSGNNYNIKSPMLGTFQAENIAGCFAMAHKLGVKPEMITEAIGTFKGLHRRLEKRLEISNAPTIIDDIAHSPEKASSVLSTLRSIYSGKLIAIFEPNSGGRSRESLAKYDNAFKAADLVIIPRLTKLKISMEKEVPMEGDELAATIAKTHGNVRYIENDKELIASLIGEAKNGDVIAFLGSHGFRGMIEETITSLRQQYRS